MHDIHDPDAAPVGERLHLNESFVVDSEMAGAPTLKPEVFLGLGRRPGG
jgi:hypothetical protein